ncbi:putative germin-like protein 2-1 [Cynara cardunculus var. scolymus]|uniref:putative germin-like protein 2-1 n=1 Tax=Cynara cardunculus var. scolymus TaxID=59895 RepID=UPI000D62B87E|nr:putative germin-like protein 2-1 [Cynara cardunculus var. scolymus]
MNVSNVDVFDEFVNVILHHKVAYFISYISRVNKNKFPLPNNDISFVFLIGLLMGSCSLAMASDSNPLQDFCVAVPKRRVFVNGEVCKDPKLVRADDFFFSGLHLMRDTSNAVGSNVTTVTVAELPRLNTFGISMARIDFAPSDINPPHTHTPPRATKILTVLEGNIKVGFVTSNPENRLITKDLQKGDVFVFPQGLVHFQRNIGNIYALVIAALSSHNLGAITIVNAVFDSNPDISKDLLVKAFQMYKNVV